MKSLILIFIILITITLILIKTYNKKSNNICYKQGEFPSNDGWTKGNCCKNLILCNEKSDIYYCDTKNNCFKDCIQQGQSLNDSKW